MKVTENSEFSLKIPGKTPEEIKANAADTLKEAELSQFSDQYPHELPSRQKQLRIFARGTNQSAALNIT